MSVSNQPGQNLGDRAAALLGQAFSSGNSVEILKNGAEIFPAMLDAIRTANNHIEFLTFIYWSGDIANDLADALCERARAGVDVRVVLDSFGAFKMSRALVGKLEEAGVQLRWFRPLATWRFWTLDNRTHRKILVCDGKVAFTGGVGIAEQWQGDARHSGEWRDTHFMIRGPAVADVQAGFWSNWLEACGGLGAEALPLVGVPGAQLADRDPSQSDDQDASRLLVIRSTASTRWSDAAAVSAMLVMGAQSRISIATAYFAPDSAMANALLAAKQRGVDVEILFPGRHADKRVSQLASAREIERLIKAECSVWRYQKTMLHTKIMLIDHRYALVGSANFNHRSWMKDDELNVLIDDPEITRRLSEQFRDDTRDAEQLSEDNFWEQSWRRKVLAFLARPLRPQV